MKILFEASCWTRLVQAVHLADASGRDVLIRSNSNSGLPMMDAANVGRSTTIGRRQREIAPA